MDESPAVLVLGGSTQARELVAQLVDHYQVTLSFAGTTSSTTSDFAPGVRVRRGGFGGVDGLVQYLREHDIVALIDATHPYAASMHRHAIAGSAKAKVAHMRLERPAWRAPKGAHWIEVNGGEEAVEQVLARGFQRVLVTTGKTFLDPWRGLGNQATVIVRSIDPADVTGIDQVETITKRGPFSYADEVALLATCDAMVTRNAGGDDTKIRAAIATHTPILVWRRPELPPCTCVESVEQAVAWLHANVPIS